jgi:hypothetical protein
MSHEGLKAAAETETKFQFYVIALIFTILALAIQTSPEIAPKVSRIFELLSWAMLLIAGFLGLAYVERVPLATRLLWDQHLVEQELANRKEFDLTAGNDDKYFSSSPNKDTPTNYLQKKKYLNDKQLASITKFRQVAYQVTRWLMLFGVLLLAFARGYPIFQEIAGASKPSESKLILSTPN